MPLNWTTGALMRPAGCLPCCSGAPTPPGECACALLIPPFGSPYVDYATAEGVIATQTNGCLAFYEASTFGSLTASFDGTTLIMNGSDGAMGPGASLNFWASVSLLAGQTLSAAYSVSTDGSISVDPTFTLYRCDAATVVDTDTDPSSGGTLSVTADVDGEYYVLIQSAATGATAFSMDNSVTCSGVWWVNPVIALWDDSGTTRKLWACPKMLLPPLTESTGDWYADCAAADAVLTDALKVSNCVGYFEVAVGVDTILATNGGTSLALKVSDSTLGGFSGTGAMYGGINAEAGETITVTGATNGGTYDISASVYDDTGTLVEDFSTTGSTTATSSALPYTGRYTVVVSMTTPPPGTPPTDTTATITSSGTMSVNEIQARYDGGLTCPNTLDCGDTCP